LLDPVRPGCGFDFRAGKNDDAGRRFLKRPGNPFPGDDNLLGKLVLDDRPGRGGCPGCAACDGRDPECSGQKLRLPAARDTIKREKAICTGCGRRQAVPIKM
jgi:hypothetical protein